MTITAIGLWCAIGPGGALDLRTVGDTPFRAATALRSMRGDAAMAEWGVTCLDMQPVGPRLDARNVLATMMDG